MQKVIAFGRHSRDNVPLHAHHNQPGLVSGSSHKWRQEWTAKDAQTLSSQGRTATASNNPTKCAAPNQS